MGRTPEAPDAGVYDVSLSNSRTRIPCSSTIRSGNRQRFHVKEPTCYQHATTTATPPEVGPGSYSNSFRRQPSKSRPGPCATSRLFPDAFLLGTAVPIQQNTFKPSYNSIESDNKNWTRKGCGASFGRSRRVCFPALNPNDNTRSTPMIYMNHRAKPTPGPGDYNVKKVTAGRVAGIVSNLDM